MASQIMSKRIGREDCFAVPRLLGELDDVIRENGVDLIGHGFEQVLQELLSSAAVAFSAR
ncbi:hypothetical protein OIHEL45_16946 [Sulfitobacter indolifex HEL-45]|uniref:Uncharacterized protein n=1 Tax=Sulfitobacter indolifex HEL-45 TaxID=391624 RepID=A0ABM9X1X3_9RHOB|nr:hypothetical protein OIHEL45_16946 [Sulfitobacter indolifex HEL-45]